MADERPAISPTLTVGQLLEHYPELEPTLIGLAPAFTKLRHPVLRKTVARVATLEQAARIGGLGTRDLVGALRRAAGHTTIDLEPQAIGACSAAASCGMTAGTSRCERPAWAGTTCGSAQIDADALLAADTHPLGLVRKQVAEARAGEVVLLTSSFRPEPLLEEMRRTGVDVYCEEERPQRFVTYLRKPEEPSRPPTGVEPERT